MSGYTLVTDPDPPHLPHKFVWGVRTTAMGNSMGSPCIEGDAGRVWSTLEGAEAYADRFNLRHSMASAYVYKMPLDFDYDP